MASPFLHSRAPKEYRFISSARQVLRQSSNCFRDGPRTNGNLICVPVTNSDRYGGFRRSQRERRAELECSKKSGTTMTIIHDFHELYRAINYDRSRFHFLSDLSVRLARHTLIVISRTGFSISVSVELDGVYAGRRRLINVPKGNGPTIKHCGCTREARLTISKKWNRNKTRTDGTEERDRLVPDGTLLKSYDGRKGKKKGS